MTQLGLFPVAREVSPASEWCQRWSAGRHSWRRAGTEPAFHPHLYRVEPLPEAAARAYVLANHYSGSYPAALQRYGMWTGGRLVGVAVLGVPTSARVLTNVLPTCEPYRQSAVLARFVLADDVPANGETWFLARVFTLAAETGMRGIVSFADPVPRWVGGRLLFPGHVGIIYQAANAVFTGRSTARRLTLLPSGQVFNDRAKSKVRQQERGHEAIERRHVSLGASVPRAGQRPAAWLAQALDDIGAVAMTHGGNLRYVWTLGDRTQRRRTQIAVPPQLYPKRRDD
jgi:hypothetical protein